jgi:hypothetical protein
LSSFTAITRAGGLVRLGPCGIGGVQHQHKMRRPCDGFSNQSRVLLARLVVREVHVVIGGDQRAGGDPVVGAAELVGTRTARGVGEPHGPVDELGAATQPRPHDLLRFHSVLREVQRPRELERRRTNRCRFAENRRDFALHLMRAAAAREPVDEGPDVLLVPGECARFEFLSINTPLAPLEEPLDDPDDQFGRDLRRTGHEFVVPPPGFRLVGAEVVLPPPDLDVLSTAAALRRSMS